MSGARWFRVPCELLSAPPTIVGRASTDPRRARRPPALANFTPSAAATKKIKISKEVSMEGCIVMPDRAQHVPETVHLRHGRYLKQGRVVAVPQLVKDWEDDLQDEKNELLVVDLICPGGAWYEDPEVSHVHVQTGAGEKLLPVGPLRDYIRAHVKLFARPATSLRKLNVPCRLQRAALHVFALISMCDFAEMLLTAEDA